MLSHECVRRVAIGSITAFLLTLSGVSFGNSCGVLKSAAERYTNRTDPATRDDIQKGKEIRWIMGYLHHAKSMYYQLRASKRFLIANRISIPIQIMAGIAMRFCA
ncbi:MAG: hypothetical protein EBZ14_09795 [Gammaproteobacteria bacterium]|nr:hypothetical protein [Gammaproteobacteria bacterium]